MTSPEPLMLAKAAGDMGSFTVLLSTYFSWLPDAAALLTILWLSLRIWETKTVQDWRERRRCK